MNAYMGKILRIDLSSGKIDVEELRMDWAEKFIGGAGLAARYLYDEVPGGIDALGAANKLIFMTGPLTGTASASAARYSVVAKSPLTWNAMRKEFLPKRKPMDWSSNSATASWWSV